MTVWLIPQMEGKRLKRPRSQQWVQTRSWLEEPGHLWVQAHIICIYEYIYCFFLWRAFILLRTRRMFLLLLLLLVKVHRCVCGKHVAWVMLDMPSYQLRQDVLRSILQIRQRAGPVKSGTFESADRSAGLIRQVRGKLVFDNAAWQPYWGVLCVDPADCVSSRCAVLAMHQLVILWKMSCILLEACISCLHLTRIIPCRKAGSDRNHMAWAFAFSISIEHSGSSWRILAPGLFFRSHPTLVDSLRCRFHVDHTVESGWVLSEITVGIGWKPELLFSSFNFSH